MLEATPFLTLGNDVVDIIPIVAIVGGISVALVSIICGTIRRSAESKAREESRREIAAYVAEGSITADDAFKLLTTNPPKQKSC